REGATPNAILLDIVMPGMTGFEVLEAIKREGLKKEAKLIVLSNQGQQSDIDQAKALGANGYIVKASAIPSEVFTETIKIIETQP
ncbi:MAG TPA: response regulator, partial [Candidatus Paceibacterota bacterium]